MPLGKHRSLLALSSLLATACAVPDPGPGQSLAETLRSAPPPALPVQDSDPSGDGDGIEHYVYDADNNLSLTVYKARLPSDVSTPKGIAFFVHGGAWAVGNRTDIHDAARRMWEQGFTLVSVQYRLSSWNWARKPVNPFPAAIHDVKRAIRWVKNHFQTERNNLPVIGIGHSAGGHLVSLAATSSLRPGETLPAGLPNLDDNPDDPLRHVSASLDGAINLAGPMDLQQAIRDGVSWWVRDAATAFLNCKDKGVFSSCDANTVRSASPVSYYSTGDAPLYVAYAEKDPLVPPKNGCGLGQRYAADSRVAWYWMDLVEADVPTSLRDQLLSPSSWVSMLGTVPGFRTLANLEHHFVSGLNAHSLDAWTNLVRQKQLPPMPPEGMDYSFVGLCTGK